MNHHIIVEMQHTDFFLEYEIVLQFWNMYCKLTNWNMFVSLHIHQIVLKRHLPWHRKKVLVILRCSHLLYIILINCDTKNIIDIGEVCMGAVYGRETWLEFLPVTKHEK